MAMINDDCREKSGNTPFPWQMRPMFGVTKMVSNRSFRTVNRSTGFKPIVAYFSIAQVEQVDANFRL
jgi:hypothetical protein